MAGLRDEAATAGHRRTSVGALPVASSPKSAVWGLIIQSLWSMGLDKRGQDFRGDSASVLLEVFDPEQNRLFVGFLP